MYKKNTAYDFSVNSMQEDGSFAGYASVFGVIDSQNDVITRGAFRHTLKKRAGAVKLLWQHRVEEPIGLFTKLCEDKRGLYVEGRLLLDLPRGMEAYILLKNNVINGLSIGYVAVEADYNAEIGVRMITQLALWEVSLVTFPANEEAVVTRVKASGEDDAGLVGSIDRAIGVLGF